MPWRNNWYWATSSQGKKTWYWHDGNGCRRWVGARRRYQIKKMMQRGLPAVIQFKKRGSLLCLEITPRRGFLHLTTPSRVMQAYNYGCRYHISLAMLHEIRAAPKSARLLEALRFIRDEFKTPKECVLEVEEVQDNHVVCLREDQAVFQHTIHNIQYVRAHSTSCLHFTLPQPSVSM